MERIPTTQAVQQWEYSSHHIERFGPRHGAELRDNLAAMGQQGWELVSLCPVVGGTWTMPGDTNYLLAVFKRPVAVPLAAPERVLAGAGRI